MIYGSKKQWEDLEKSHKLRKQGFVLLDLSVLDELTHQFQFIAHNTNINVNQLIKHFEQIIINCHDIKTRVDAIALSYRSFSETITDLPYQNFNGANQYEILKKIYTTTITLGVSIPIELLQTYSMKEEYIKSIRLYSIRIDMAKGDQQFQLVRQFIKKHHKAPLQTVHLHLILQKPEDLIAFQNELILNQYPIEYVIVSSNLLEVIKIQTHYPQYHQLDEQDIQDHKVYHYNRYLEKYLNSALFNVIDYYPHRRLQFTNSSEANEQIFNDILRDLKNMEIRKKERRVFKGGIRIPGTLFINSLREFKGDISNFNFVQTCIQRVILLQLGKVIDGDFKSIQKTIAK